MYILGLANAHALHSYRCGCVSLENHVVIASSNAISVKLLSLTMIMMSNKNVIKHFSDVEHKGC